MKNLSGLCLIMFSVIISGCSSDKPWENLVRKDLSNWIELNGTAPFELKNGEITGTTVFESPNSFLCTKEKYGDFILEFDTWFDPQMNSGVQFRSESLPDYQDGRVHGYQVEMDPSSRSWSGGIYDEARRGWLYTLDKNQEAKKALKVGDWNHYRVEAIGNSIRTWVNAIPCADLIDAMTPEGFIALQVHSVGNDSSKIGLLVKWKNIKIITKDVEKYATPYEPVIPQISFLDNLLTEREKADGWKLLFDGSSPEGWVNAKTMNFPASGWNISDGVLFVTPETRKTGEGGDIVSTGKFRNFELSVDFIYTKGANSGIKYFVDIEAENGSLASIGCEYQVLDDRNHPDAKAGFAGNRTLAGLYDLIAPVYKRDNGENQWNRAGIIVNGKKVQHWLNGFMTVEYERATPAWRELVATSKFKPVKGFGEATEGRILLQDHGNKVGFKNIKIREIK
ncbi:MAG TPA: DUF1080 domain-containing protein [Bacteroidales bacterium]|nr:DUF1080 domain-containing protein [Bacteroidales bacterium]HBZ20860.1 DUF1080 domain-containing protein [Bacteroidales bacterium]